MGVNILWGIITGFLLGVFVRSFVLLGFSFALFFILLGIIFIVLILFESSQKRLLVVLAVTCISFGCGIARMNSDVLRGDPQLTVHLDQKVELVGIVSAEPDVRDASTRLFVDVSQIATSTVPVHSRVLVVVPPHTDVAYGDEIRITGVLKLPETFDTGNGRQFNYPLYLATYGIGYEVSPASVSQVGKNGGNYFIASALYVKQKYLAGIDATLPQPEAGLAGGITVGDKRSIGPELSAAFQKVSLIHMVVLSGYNITVVINAAAQLLVWTSRSVQFGAGILIVIFFAIISGGATSAVRSGLMALLAMYARITKRSYDALRALAVVSFVMVLWNPFTFAFDPSFQLSALATLGMIVYTPIVTARMNWVTLRWGLREIISSTLATQFVVLPFLLFQSGQLAVFALPANFFALIPVPLAMVMSAATSMLGLCFGRYAIPLALPTYILLSYIIHVAEFFANLPFSSVTIIPFASWILFATYVCIFVLAYVLTPQSTDV